MAADIGNSEGITDQSLDSSKRNSYSSAVTTETDSEVKFELTSRDAIQILLWTTCRISIFPSETESAFNKKFYRTDFCNETWDSTLGKNRSEVEVDICGHVREEQVINGISVISSQNETSPFCVKLFDYSKISVLMTPAKANSSKFVDISPDKKMSDVDIAVAIESANRLYAIGEVTHGSGVSVSSKLLQLEVACKVAMLKEGTVDVLEAVGLLLIISPGDNEIYTTVFNRIQSDSNLSLVRKVAQAGRFLFIQNKATVEYRIGALESRLKNIESDVHSLEEIVCSIQSDIKFIQSMLKYAIVLNGITLIALVVMIMK